MQIFGNGGFGSAQLSIPGSPFDLEGVINLT